MMEKYARCMECAQMRICRRFLGSWICRPCGRAFMNWLFEDDAPDVGALMAKIDKLGKD